MFLEFSDNNGKKYIRVVESLRVDKDGKKVSRKITVKNIGPVSRFDDGKPEYLARLKASFLAGDPIIKELLPYIPSKQDNYKYSFVIKGGSDYCSGHPLFFSHILIEKIMEELKINQVVRSYKHFSKTHFELLNCIRLMIYEAVLNPTLKMDMLFGCNEYFGFSIDRLSKNMITETLDFIHAYKNQILNRINPLITEEFSADNSTVYYIADKFYYKKGKSNLIKEYDGKKGVNTGLFLNEIGYPVSYRMFGFNFKDEIPEEISFNLILNEEDTKKYVFVSSKDIYGFDNIKNFSDKNSRYIVSQTISKEDKADCDWVYDNSDYITVNEGFKYKSKIASRRVKDKDGKARILKEKIIVYWDKNLFESQIEEYLTVSNLLYDDFKKQMGYTRIVTSEIGLDDMNVIKIYNDLSGIEKQFEAVKGEFLLQQDYLKTEEQIDAYFTICVISSMILRIIKDKISREKDSREGSISEERIRRALKRWTIDSLPNKYYRFNNVDDEDLKLIFKAFSIDIPKKLYRLGDLRSLKQTVVNFAKIDKK